MDDKVKKLLQMAILTHNVIRFREVFAKKADKGFIRSPVQTKALKILMEEKIIWKT